MQYQIKKTYDFEKWISSLKDLRGKIAIVRRIERMSQGNFGDVKFVGDTVLELRIQTGPGYRVYFTKEGEFIVILLIGGDKSTQVKDIAKAKQLWKEIKDGKEPNK